MATKVTTGLLTDNAVTDAKLSATITATTQSASDNTTSVATTAYVTTAIANLADSAPSTLNTLNELAAALGDDANFSTTVTNSIAGKLPLAGGTMTGNLVVAFDSNNSGNRLRIADTEGVSAAERTYSTSDGTGLILNHYYAVSGSPYVRYSDFVSSMGDGAATNMRFLTKPFNGNPTVALTIDQSQNATFAGGVTVNSGHVNIDAGLSYQWDDSHERIEQSDGNIEFFTNNSQAMTLNGSNLGIGITGPGASLHVDHSSSTAYNGAAEILESVIIRNKNGTDNSGVNNVASLGLQVADGATSQGFINYVRTGNNTGNFTFSQRTGSSSYAEAMRIDSSGNVGIGTNSPASLLHIDEGSADDCRIIAETHAGGDSMILFSQGASGSGTPTWGIGLDAGSGTSDGFSIGYEDTGYNDFSLTGDSKVVITTAGNVGIGTTTPGQNLTISSSGVTYSRVTTTASTQAAAHEVTNSTGGGLSTISYSNSASGSLFGLNRGGKTFLDSSQEMVIGVSANGFMSFATNAIERMRLSSNGRLHGFEYSSQEPGSTPADANSYTIGPGYMFLNRDDTATVDQITFGKNGSVAGRITTASGTTYHGSSDYRLKENVTPMVNGLERVQKLNPVSYTWINADENTVEEGFLAHEVQEAGWETGVRGEKDAADSNSMDYGRITPLLVKAIQELKAENDSLKSRIETLEG